MLSSFFNSFCFSPTPTFSFSLTLFIFHFTPLSLSSIFSLSSFFFLFVNISEDIPPFVRHIAKKNSPLLLQASGRTMERYFLRDHVPERRYEEKFPQRCTGELPCLSVVLHYIFSLLNYLTTLYLLLIHSKPSPSGKLWCAGEGLPLTPNA